MNGFRIALIGALLAFSPAMALAQTTPADAKKPAADAPAPPKPAKKPEAKKPEAKKTAIPKSQPAAKPAVKKPVKTETAAKPATKGAPKSTSTTASGTTVETYKAGQAPNLRDKDGNVILTSPDAFNVDSSTKK